MKTLVPKKAMDELKSLLDSTDAETVEFAKDGKVADLHKYTLADGRVVDLVSRETPTRGRELSLLQQIFNAVPGQIGQTAPSNPIPGGGGAPPIPPGR